jgi:hypothetical protein
MHSEHLHPPPLRDILIYLVRHLSNKSIEKVKGSKNKMRLVGMCITYYLFYHITQQYLHLEP